MNPAVVVVDGDARRDLDLDLRPAEIGGDGCDIAIAGPNESEVAAHLGVSDGAVFVQPVPDSEWPTHCNGITLTVSRWLDDGDLLRIGRTELEFRSSGAEITISIHRPDAGNGSAALRANRPPAVVPEPGRAVMIEPADFTPRAAATATRRRTIRPRVAAVWLLLALIAAAFWIVFASRSIEIEIHPTPDRTELEGSWPVLTADGRFVVLPGSYRLTAERAGHRPLAEEIVVSGDGPSAFAFTLEPLPGLVRVTTGTVTGAAILVNGEPAATSPAEIELPQGEHAVVIRAQRFAEVSRRVEIAEPGQEIDLDIVLEPAWASVTFSSRPSGAEVVVDGQQLGTTPLTTELGAGGHSVELRLAGFSPHTVPVTVVAGRDLELPTVRLEPVAARLVVRSTPAEASVTVDDSFAGVTPVTIRVEPGEMHEITVTKGGFEAHTTTVRPAAGERIEIDTELVALRGRVRFTSTPPGAELVIDGESRGRTELTLDLPERPHRVEMRLDGYLPFTATVAPRAGVVSRVDATLDPADLVARLPAVTTTSQGVELVLIEGGRFTTGASRRVPGRRANETQLDVEITRPYYLATREVTNREYREFHPDHRSGGAGSANLEIDHHPVVRVSWENAARYCNWLSVKEGLIPVYVEAGGRLVATTPFPSGYRLPTEAEWVWAARYDGRGGERKYGWGDELPVPLGAGNYGDRSADAILGDSLPDYHDGHPGTAPAGSFTANPRGLFNLGGNVSEWVHDRYTIYPPGGQALTDPVGPDEGEYHVIRGASWMDDTVTELRLSYRDYGDGPRPDVGFRISRSAE